MWKVYFRRYRMYYHVIRQTQRYKLNKFLMSRIPIPVDDIRDNQVREVNSMRVQDMFNAVLLHAE